MYILKIGKHELKITHGKNILFPKSKIPKNEIIEYYLNIAPIMIPHTKERPLMMHRFVNGIDEPGFFQKNIPDYFPKWIKRIKIPRKEKEPIYQAVCNNTETLVYLANQICITPHLWLSKIDKLHFPDKLIFDLDPSDKGPNAFKNVMVAAKKMKKLLESLGLETFVMTTGSRGLHIVVPIKRENNFDYVKNFARDISSILVDQYPKILTNEMRKEKRGKKIFIDIYRNAYAQTSVAPYAIRAKEGAPIATPIEWKEVTSKLTPTKYTIKNIFKRLSQKNDPWEDIEKHACSLKKARKIVDSIIIKLKIFY